MRVGFDGHSAEILVAPRDTIVISRPDVEGIVMIFYKVNDDGSGQFQVIINPGTEEANVALNERCVGPLVMPAR